MSEDRTHYDTGRAHQRPVLPKETLFENGKGYSPPSPAQIASVIQYLGWTGGETGRRLGVGGRNVRKWTQTNWSDENQKQPQITYAAWQLLLAHAGIVTYVWDVQKDTGKPLMYRDSDALAEALITEADRAGQ